MRGIKLVQFSKYSLLLINFLAVIFYASVFLFATQFISTQNESHALLEQLNAVPYKPELIFTVTVVLFFTLMTIIVFRDYSKSYKNRDSIDQLLLAELIVALGLLVSLHFSYNGFLLLVFADVFFHFKDMYNLIEKRYWLFFLILSFGLLLLTDANVLSTFLPLPDINTYINFFPIYLRIVLIFVKNFLTSINLIVFIISLIFYIMNAITEKHNLEEEVRMVSQVNVELNNYVALTEKITEDRERKRISREIHDTLGHALTGISAGIDAVKVLIDIDPKKAKNQLVSVSNVVREGIVDVRRSLKKLRPDALESRTLQDALNKIINDYQEISQIQIDFHYDWQTADLSVAVEDIIFRVIQESITNSLRHGHASKIDITMSENNDYTITIKDNGIGAKEFSLGYGLMQMRERLAIIGAQVTFNGEDGFETFITIPKTRSNYDKSNDS
ncbi:sensor histidine kinase [Streptococcus uberis]|uniref:sensor histidine kinase n=1 Tax=Streptococcus uberis TaxID=1349 RepID=UPI001C97E415|nr:sensor histidine kinase [Streptococcus uberis]MBY4765280.1 sensor histidine kinase [Streptococcus uberis]MCR4253786.1 sensor histidine kinase [Streptococcus uberis]MCR4255617.1 sensor histidine kinase [Streptococcus uberis]MCR4260074.1 sensor histidine kinase [Streptococcus uberis]MCR4262445.1 sensor histidine kinase [Streptococcus uberis]